MPQPIAFEDNNAAFSRVHCFVLHVQETLTVVPHHIYDSDAPTRIRVAIEMRLNTVAWLCVAQRVYALLVLRRIELQLDARQRANRLLHGRLFPDIHQISKAPDGAAPTRFG